MRAIPSIQRSVSCLTAALLLALPGSAAGDGVPDPGVWLPGLGRDFVAKHCPEGAEADACPLEDVLATAFVHARLGAFDLWFPAAALEQKARAADLAEAAAAVVALQRAWVELVGGGTEEVQALLADLALVEGWARGWKPGELARLAGSDERELFTALEPAEDVRAAALRAQAALGSRDVLGVAPQYTEGIGMVLCPTRRDFMELVGYLGLADPEFRQRGWVPGVHQWTQLWHGQHLILSLQYAPWSGFNPRFNEGLDARKFDSTGLSQHVAQQAAEALVFRNFNRPELRLMEKALAVDLVVAAIGEINTLDGEGGISNTGAQTQPYERFVPGGNSAGGILPAIPAAPFDAVAESRWREGKGKDHFVAALRKGQKEGARRAAKERDIPLPKDKLAHFELLGDGRHIVTAPFLGPHANERPYPPAEFLPDYKEFFRSYSASFVHWLRTQGRDDEAASEQAFRELVQLLGAEGSDVAFHEAVEQAFGLPLSARDGSADTLEWRFLKHLAKGK